MECFMRDEYFSGDVGVYYIPKNDEIVLLEKRELVAKTVSISPPIMETAYAYEVEYQDFSCKKILVCNTENIVRIGDFK